MASNHGTHKGRRCCDFWEAEVARLRAELNEAQERSIEARNPGIDMDEVRALRALREAGL